MKTYRLTDELRTKLKKPLGRLIRGQPNETMKRLSNVIDREKPAKILAIGDTVTLSMAKHGVSADVYVVDNKVMRKPISPVSLETGDVVHVRNPPGTITPEAWEAIQKAAKQSSIIKIVVEGEEDLLTLPAIIHAPEGSIVVYGQPNVGIVLVRVTARKKRETRALVEALTV